MFPDPEGWQMSPDSRDLNAKRRWTLPTTVAILLVGGVLTSSLLTACLRRGPDDAPVAAGGGGSPSTAALPPDLFRDWPTDGNKALKKPDVALILSGQQHSYLKFCGCSTPQLGGFERRYNFMMKLKSMGWPLVAADLGDLVQFKEGIPEQAFLKCDIAMKALEILGYAAMTLGEDDHTLPLDDGVGQFYLQNPNAFPRPLVVNLANKPQNFPHPVRPNESWIGDWQAVGGQNGSPRIAVIGLTGLSVINKIKARNPRIQFINSDQTLAAMKAVIAQINGAKDKADLKLLLFQGSAVEAERLCGATLFPNAFDVILCLSEEDTPPGQPTMAGNTMIVRVGHRGRFVGVVGAYRTGNAAKPFDLHYQSVQMGEDFETAKGKEAGHPVLKLLDTYAQQVKDQKFLGRMLPRPIVPPAIIAGRQNLDLKYVGSDKCLACHQADAAIWQKTDHFHAYDALSKKADKPALRQYDPECITCHVVGYTQKGGFVTNTPPSLMKNVGCESCHGPGSAHVGLPGDKDYRLAMSPWKGTDPTALLPTPETLVKGFNAMSPKEKAVYNRVNGDMCQKCHDPDNDPHFKFEKNWLQVIHGKNAKAPIPPPPPAAAAAVQKQPGK
jgi:hypothetical protein